GQVYRPSHPDCSSHPPPSSQISPLSLHDALPISKFTPTFDSPLPATRARAVSRLAQKVFEPRNSRARRTANPAAHWAACVSETRSEEHTSELQSLRHLVCRLLLEKKKGATTEPWK